MLTDLRRDMQALLAAVPCMRKPALRRCDDPAALLATNLPFVADDAAIAAFVQQAAAAGWQVTERNGWLLLDHPIVPPDVPPAQATGDLACCISLLSRHAQDAGDATAAIRALAKAAETSLTAVEALCRTLHTQWAAALRMRQPLPGALLPYLHYVARLCTQKEADR